jgi:hypothetical protein
MTVSLRAAASASTAVGRRYRAPDDMFSEPEDTFREPGETVFRVPEVMVFRVPEDSFILSPPSPIR